MKSKRFIPIFLLSIFCCSCNESKTDTQLSPDQQTQSLEKAAADADKLLKSGDAEKIADLFIEAQGDKREHFLGFAKKLNESLLKFQLHNSKTKGDMGVVILSFNESDSHYHIFAKKVNGTWKFFFQSFIWTDPLYIKSDKLSEQDLNDAITLQKWAAKQPLVGSSGVGAAQRLAWYVLYIPENLKIEKFYETPSPSMDHEYMWKIKIEGTAEFKQFAKQLTQSSPNVSGANNLSNVPVFESHPKWWKDIDFNKGKLFQHRVTVIGSKGSQKADLFALFDHDAGFLYIQAL